MKSVAVLLDGGFVLVKLRSLLGKKFPTADNLVNFATRCLSTDEELFRIYYYDCWPYSETEKHPITGKDEDFSKSPIYIRQTRFLESLQLKDNVAVRSGELMFIGWSLKWKSTLELLRKPRQIEETDLVPDLKQKGVDIKIGLDIAWLSSKRIVDRIILVSSDSDLVPAMKFARREGVQVVLVTMGHKQIKRELKIHVDEVRDVVFP